MNEIFWTPDRYAALTLVHSKLLAAQLSVKEFDSVKLLIKALYASAKKERELEKWRAHFKVSTDNDCLTLSVSLPDKPSAASYSLPMPFRDADGAVIGQVVSIDEQGFATAEIKPEYAQRVMHRLESNLFNRVECEESLTFKNPGMFTGNIV